MIKITLVYKTNFKAKKNKTNLLKLIFNKEKKIQQIFIMKMVDIFESVKKIHTKTLSITN